MRLLIALIFTGLSACAATNDAAFCGPDFSREIAGLRSGLERHPETHDDVGNPGTNIVKSQESVCQ